MQLRDRRRWGWVAGSMIAGFGAYFALALWAKLSYVDPTPKGSLVVQLYKPFEPVGGFAYRAAAVDVAKLHGATGVLIYEDGWPLREDSSYSEIKEWGHGLALQEGKVIMLSSRDGSDPNRNGKLYWAVKP